MALWAKIKNEISKGFRSNWKRNVKGLVKCIQNVYVSVTISSFMAMRAKSQPRKLQFTEYPEWCCEVLDQDIFG